ncbi:MAG: DUF2330 domain-containing protein [Pirellulales bacterium]|nr:DUF2330 domain-containing protein [Pirellulales bacterium]
MQPPTLDNIRPGIFRLVAGTLVLALSIMVFIVGTPVVADPCGMVPPIRSTAGIERVDIQRTYVCFDRGVASLVLRPGFRGRVEDFGMLIPFPQPPEIRKVDDRIFHHIVAAIDPPEVTINLTPQLQGRGGFGGGGFGGGGLAPPKGRHDGFGGLGVISKDEVKVIKEEAIGMYEVAVLAAGSAESLNAWMSDHGYRYPNGMDKVCNEYIEEQWGFVAVKTRVAAKTTIDPQPGQRSINADLPSRAGFVGHVQAMGFRFYSEELVVPMRLSAFNTGEMRNVVYLLTKGPKAIRNIPEEYVVRQVAGKQLLHNLTELLPVRIIGGKIKNGRIANGTLVAGRVENLTQDLLAKAKPARDPVPHNGLAKRLFASDLLAIGRRELLHSFEKQGNQLALISASLKLDDAKVSPLYDTKPIEGDELDAYEDALEWLRRMTLTVVDGDFPRDTLSRENLTFQSFRMPGRRNHRNKYDAMIDGPAGPQQGIRLATNGVMLGPRMDTNPVVSITVAIAGVLALGLVIHRWQRRCQRRA